MFRNLKAVIFDWAGTLIDFGSCAPTSVIVEIFRRRNTLVTMSQAREPMGRSKREHLAYIAAMPAVSDAWKAAHEGHPITELDIDSLYVDFLPLQKQILSHHSKLIDGAAAIAQWCQSHGLRIGTTTGYTRELLDIVLVLAKLQGFTPECALGVEDAPLGRPAPFLLFEAAKRMAVYPMWHMVKIDDTPVGIQAGRNAGCWTIGVSKTGNCVGLTEEQWIALEPSEQAIHLDRANKILRSAGAHATVESVADIRETLLQFDTWLSNGILPSDPIG